MNTKHTTFNFNYLTTTEIENSLLKFDFINSNIDKQFVAPWKPKFKTKSLKAILKKITEAANDKIPPKNGKHYPAKWLFRLTNFV